MELFLWIIGVIFVLAIVGGIAQGIQQTKAARGQDLALARLPDFVPVVSYGGAAGGAGVAIDAERQKFAISRAGGSVNTVFNFDELVAVEVLKNGSSLQKTNRGSQVTGAAVGALLLGPVGLLLGGLTGSKRQVEKVDRLSLNTRDLVNPVHEVVFHDLKGSNPESFVVRAAVEQMDAWHGRFQTILSMRQDDLRRSASAGDAPLLG